eukprot:gnl/Trimastix_PCT/362.p1 GENE.gnl/Trimastix_PCT/362~~gnl/Trimastix_PCT/362.p1  ORF type:complete len:434 (+),score=62.51 gnl/Trimastix_PCT/362:895-2196(+)
MTYQQPVVQVNTTGAPASRTQLGGKEIDPFAIYVTNLAPETTTEALIEFFSRLGEVLPFPDTLIVDHKPKESKRHGFVRFTSSEVVQRLIGIGVLELDGQRINIRAATTKKAKTSRTATEIETWRQRMQVEHVKLQQRLQGGRGVPPRRSGLPQFRGRGYPPSPSHPHPHPHARKTTPNQGPSPLDNIAPPAGPTDPTGPAPGKKTKELTAHYRTLDGNLSVFNDDHLVNATVEQLQELKAKLENVTGLVTARIARNQKNRELRKQARKNKQAARAAAAPTQAPTQPAQAPATAATSAAPSSVPVQEKLDLLAQAASCTMPAPASAAPSAPAHAQTGTAIECLLGMSRTLAKTASPPQYAPQYATPQYHPQPVASSQPSAPPPVQPGRDYGLCDICATPSILQTTMCGHVRCCGPCLLGNQQCPKCRNILKLL